MSTAAEAARAAELYCAVSLDLGLKETTGPTRALNKESIREAPLNGRAAAYRLSSRCCP